MNFREEIIKLLVQHTKLKAEEIANLLTVPPDPKLGDYAFPCFKLGNPKEAAEKLKNEIEKPEFLEKIATAGPYLNFYLNQTTLAEVTLKKIHKEQSTYGKSKIGRNKTIVIDFSSPNIAKPFSIGHLRSTIIGESLSRIHKTCGFNTITVNHLGDWGTQFGKLIVAFQKWGNEEELKKEPIKYLLKLYVKFHEEETDELKEQARDIFKKLEEGDKELVTMWQTFKDLSLQEFQRIYNLLGVHFDSYHGEAFYNDKMDAAIETIKSKVKTEISEGALIVDLEKYKMSPVLLKKSNGSTTYHTRDLAAILYRFRKYNPDKILYVVGMEQKLHFQQVFKVIELMGYHKDKLIHADFGLFRFPEGKMSTRKGKVIFLEDVLNKSIDLAKKIILEKNPNLANKEDVAKMVGIGAILFADLSSDRVKNIDFNWDKMLSFEGETAPYIQYTHARACSILRKANRDITPHSDPSLLTTPEERELLKQLYNFPAILETVVKTYKPHHLAKYLFTLAQLFNEFYHKHYVLTEDINLTKARLLLVDCTRQVLDNALNLLGIKAPKEM